MNFLKGLGVSVKVAALAFLAVLAVMAAKRHKDTARKWQLTALDVKNEDVETGTMTAKAANSQAKLHNAKAKEIKKKAQERVESMGGADEDVKTILSQFRASS